MASGGSPSEIWQALPVISTCFRRMMAAPRDTIARWNMVRRLRVRPADRPVRQLAIPRIASRSRENADVSPRPPGRCPDAKGSQLRDRRTGPFPRPRCGDAPTRRHRVAYDDGNMFQSATVPCVTPETAACGFMRPVPGKTVDGMSTMPDVAPPPAASARSAPPPRDGSSHDRPPRAPAPSGPSLVICPSRRRDTCHGNREFRPEPTCKSPAASSDRKGAAKVLSTRGRRSVSGAGWLTDR